MKHFTDAADYFANALMGGSTKPVRNIAEEIRERNKQADTIAQLNGEIPQSVRERDEINNFTRIEEK